jgi:hypothetical protein
MSSGGFDDAVSTAKSAEHRDVARHARTPRRSLVVGRADAPAERDADRIAAAAVRDASTVMRKFASGVAADAAGGPVDASVHDAIQRSRGGGRRADARVQRSVESVVGAPLGNVRVHTDSAADQLSRSLGATAFTTGSDVYFRSGAYQPASSAGRELISHELAHVAQNAAGAGSRIRRKLDGSKAALIDNGGKASASSRIVRGTYAKILTELGNYEAQERAVVRKKRLDPATRKKMDRALARLETLVAAWLREHPPLGTAAAKAKANAFSKMSDAKQAANPLDTGAKDRRSHALAMLRPRLAEERRELVRPDYLARQSFNDGNVQVVKDDLFGGGVNRLDYLEHGASKSKGVFMQDRGWNMAAHGTAGSYMGIPELDTNAGARAVAMSRLADLFDASEIARTDFATHSSDTDSKNGKLAAKRTKFGTRQALAPGQEAAVLGGTGAMVASPKDVSREGQATLHDPVLQRSLNVIQIIDAIAGQLDRHWHNYYIATDGDKVTGVVGIDLDMAFAVDHRSVDPKVIDARGEHIDTSYFVGMPVLADAAFRVKVLAVSPDTVRAALGGLLTDAEIDSTLVRFRLVQDALRNIDPGNLIGTWNAATAERQIDGATSYLGTMRDAITGHTFAQPATPILHECFMALEFTNAFNVAKALVQKKLLPIVLANTLTPLQGMTVVRGLERYLTTDAKVTRLIELHRGQVASARAQLDQIAAARGDVAGREKAIADARTNASPEATIAEMERALAELRRSQILLDSADFEREFAEYERQFDLRRDRLIAAALNRQIELVTGAKPALRRPLPPVPASV